MLTEEGLLGAGTCHSLQLRDHWWVPGISLQPLSEDLIQLGGLLHLCPVSTILNVSPFQVGNLEENPTQKSKQQNTSGRGFRLVLHTSHPLKTPAL